MHLGTSYAVRLLENGVHFIFESHTCDTDLILLPLFGLGHVSLTSTFNPDPLCYYLSMMKYTSPTKKAHIVHDKAAGLSDADIAKRFKLHCTTVLHICKWYAKTEDYYNIKHKSGHPCKFTTHDAHYAVCMLASTDSHDIADLQQKYFPDINAETIWVRLWMCGLNGWVHRKKPLLTAAHKKKWLEWAEAHAHWTVKDDWMTVIFSDESKYNLIGSDGHPWCWRRPREEFDECYHQEKSNVP